MKYTILVHRYAKALLDYAINNNMVDEVLDDFQLVKDTLSSSKELVAILNQPFVSKNRKINILTNLFKDKVQDVTLKFIVLMIEKNRVGIIVLMYDKYYELYLEYKKIGVVTITTAVELDDKTKEALEYRLKYPEASLKELSEIISLETGKPITKSGLNHRFRKIKELADRLKDNR